MYKTESILGLIGSVIGAIFTFLFAAGTLLAVFFFRYFDPLLNNIFTNYAHFHFADYGFTYETFAAFVIPVVAVCAVVAFAIAAVSCLLGFIGTAKLNKNDKSGGVLLIVAASLAFISVVGFIPFVLLLIGGIMAVSRKPAVAAQSELNKTV